jgi:hypothetical protein
VDRELGVAWRDNEVPQRIVDPWTVLVQFGAVVVERHNDEINVGRPDSGRDSEPDRGDPDKCNRDSGQEPDIQFSFAVHARTDPIQLRITNVLAIASSAVIRHGCVPGVNETLPATSRYLNVSTWPQWHVCRSNATAPFEQSKRIHSRMVLDQGFRLERTTRIELASSAWKVARWGVRDQVVRTETRIYLGFCIPLVLTVSRRFLAFCVTAVSRRGQCGSGKADLR